jgi:hypothetical protein
MAANNIFDQMSHDQAPVSRAISYSPPRSASQSVASVPTAAPSNARTTATSAPTFLPADLVAAGWLLIRNVDGFYAIGNTGRTPKCNSVAEVIDAIHNGAVNPTLPSEASEEAESSDLSEPSQSSALSRRSSAGSTAAKKSGLRTCHKCGAQYRGRRCPKGHPLTGVDDSHADSDNGRSRFRAAGVLGRDPIFDEAPGDGVEPAAFDPIAELVAAGYNLVSCLETTYGSDFDPIVAECAGRLTGALDIVQALRLAEGLQRPQAHEKKRERAGRGVVARTTCTAPTRQKVPSHV